MEDRIKVKLEAQPFAAGAMRNAFKMKIVADDGSTTDWVAKGFVMSSEFLEELVLSLRLFASQLILAVFWWRDGFFSALSFGVSCL